MGWGGMGWIVLAQDTERLRDVVNAKINLFQRMRGTAGSSEGVLASQEGLCSMDLVNS